MQDKEIIEKWKSGLSKDKLALIYKREYNQQIRIIRSEVKNRHSGKFITNIVLIVKGRQEVVIYGTSYKR